MSEHLCSPPAHRTRTRCRRWPCDAREPTIYLYDNPLPLWDVESDWRFSRLRDIVRASGHQVDDGNCADYYLMSNQVAHDGSRSTTRVVRSFEELARRHAFWNESVASGRASHLALLPCDHGPGDCMYDRKVRFTRSTPKTVVPVELNPASRRRLLAFVGPSGMPGGVTHHIAGLDVRLPQDERHQCGPFCGLGKLRPREALLHTLRRLSPWWSGRDEAEREALLTAPRPLRLFFAGRIRGNRELLLHGVQASWRGWLVRDSAPGSRLQRGLDHAAQAAAAEAGLNLSSPDWFGEAMSRADFCLSPLGAHEGDSDRYLPAILYGCIPVWVHPGEVAPLDEALPWANVSLHLQAGPCDTTGSCAGAMASLRAMLARVSQRQLVAMRRAMAAMWPRLLWTRPFGSYLGETGEADAFATLVEVLRLRLARASEHAGAVRGDGADGHGRGLRRRQVDAAPSLGRALPTRGRRLAVRRAPSPGFRPRVRSGGPQARGNGSDGGNASGSGNLRGSRSSGGGGGGGGGSSSSSSRLRQSSTGASPSRDLQRRAMDRAKAHTRGYKDKAAARVRLLLTPANRRPNPVRLAGTAAQRRWPSQ